MQARLREQVSRTTTPCLRADFWASQTPSPVSMSARCAEITKMRRWTVPCLHRVRRPDLTLGWYWCGVCIDESAWGQGETHYWETYAIVSIVTLANCGPRMISWIALSVSRSTADVASEDNTMRLLHSNVEVLNITFIKNKNFRLEQSTLSIITT